MKNIIFATSKICLLLIYFLSASQTSAQQISKKNEAKSKSLTKKGAVWIPDNGDGTYNNPIIQADYSDPDAIRAGDDYYMTSSSFSHFPGLPVLHSKDLVNWKIISHAVIKYPIKSFNKPQHGNGIWAPSLRYHNGEFYIYYGDPDYGIFMTKAKSALGPWEPLTLVREAKGWIDPCPLWDDDGNVYLVHAWANSRSGIKHILTINKLSADGKKILDDGIKIFDGTIDHPTTEGPKFYKRNGYYYIFAPAGGVKPGWQIALRSKNIYGPYEVKKVLEQGSTKINGPHQGAWVQTQTGEDWFLHFQDRYAYGRIVHLQPMHWENDWPVMGIDYDGNGIGEPVSLYKKPTIGNKNFPIEVPQTNDEFSYDKLGMQWQWQANFNTEWTSLKARKGWLRFYSQKLPDGSKNLWDVPQLMLQKLPATKFNATVKIDFTPKEVGEKAGLIIFGLDYSYISMEKTVNGFMLSQIICNNADRGTDEKIVANTEIKNSKVFLRVEVKPEKETEIIPKVLCLFSYSIDGKTFSTLGNEFVAKEGKWVGAKVGVFSVTHNNKPGYTDFDWIRFEE